MVALFQQIVDCCIVKSGDYIFIVQQEGVYDPREELPPTHFVTYRVRKEATGDPWGCLKFEKNNFDGTKVVHVSDDIFLCVDRDRIVYFYNLAQDDGYETPIPNNVISRSVYGLQNIQGTVYAVGQPRAVARRDGPNQWTLISQEAKQGVDTVLLPGDTPSSQSTGSDLLVARTRDNIKCCGSYSERQILDSNQNLQYRYGRAPRLDTRPDRMDGTTGIRTTGG